MGMTMNYRGLQEKYCKPRKQKKKEKKHEQYQLGKEYFTASQWMDYKDWLKEQKLKGKLEKELKKKKTKKGKKSNTNKNSNTKKEKKPEKITKEQYQKYLKDERWLKKREEVFNTKGYVCCKCGSRFGLQVHHLSYERGKKPWEYPLDNLIVLCEKCHHEVHEDPDSELNPYHSRTYNKK